jgi:hypothetical protein
MRQSEVEQVCGDHLGNRFSLGNHAPLSAPDLHSEIGDLSDTEAARRILDNEYVFSDDWDAATVDLLKASAQLRLESEDIPNSNSEVTVEEFMTFWATCKEATSSSKSGRHFGHYHAISNDTDLALLQV